MKKYVVIIINNYNQVRIKECNNEQHAKNYLVYVHGYNKVRTIIAYTNKEELNEQIDLYLRYAKQMPKHFYNRLRCNRFGRTYAF